jgi:hypothetical protein
VRHDITRAERRARSYKQYHQKRRRMWSVAHPNEKMQRHRPQTPDCGAALCLLDGDGFTPGVCPRDNGKLKVYSLNRGMLKPLRPVPTLKIYLHSPGIADTPSTQAWDNMGLPNGSRDAGGLPSDPRLLASSPHTPFHSGTRACSHSTGAMGCGMPVRVVHASAEM